MNKTPPQSPSQRTSSKNQSTSSSLSDSSGRSDLSFNFKNVKFKKSIAKCSDSFSCHQCIEKKPQTFSNILKHARTVHRGIFNYADLPQDKIASCPQCGLVFVKAGMCVHINKCKVSSFSAPSSPELEEQGPCPSLGLGLGQESIVPTHSLESASTLAVQTFNALISTGDIAFVHPQSPTKEHQACTRPRPKS